MNSGDPGMGWGVTGLQRTNFLNHVFTTQLAPHTAGSTPAWGRLACLSPFYVRDLGTAGFGLESIPRGHRGIAVLGIFETCIYFVI